nr:proline-rich acidic protein 1 isoform X2 [Microcebus murinus]
METQAGGGAGLSRYLTPLPQLPQWEPACVRPRPGPQPHSLTPDTHTPLRHPRTPIHTPVTHTPPNTRQHRDTPPTHAPLTYPYNPHTHPQVHTPHTQVHTPHTQGPSHTHTTSLHRADSGRRGPGRSLGRVSLVRYFHFSSPPSLSGWPESAHLVCLPLARRVALSHLSASEPPRLRGPASPSSLTWRPGPCRVPSKQRALRLLLVTSLVAVLLQGAGAAPAAQVPVKIQVRLGAPEQDTENRAWGARVVEPPEKDGWLVGLWPAAKPELSAAEEKLPGTKAWVEPEDILGLLRSPLQGPEPDHDGLYHPPAEEDQGGKGPWLWALPPRQVLRGPEEDQDHLHHPAEGLGGP